MKCALQDGHHLANVNSNPNTVKKKKKKKIGDF
jgi:hypothetical protein